VTDFAQILRRHFVAIATATYTGDPSFGSLPGVSGEVAAIRAWLTDEQLGDRSFTPIYEELTADPTEHQIRAAFKDPPTDVRWRGADAAVVYITGHGKTDDDGQHFLVLRETDGTRLAATGFATAQLFGWLADTQIDHLLVIVDACFAGQVTERLTRRARSHWLILPSATKGQKAQLGALTEAIGKFLKTGATYNRHSAYLPVGLFADGLNDWLAPDQRVEKIYKGEDHDEHVCLPNPHYEPSNEVVETDAARRPLALPKDTLALHHRVDDRSPASRDPAGWLFTGRAMLMRELIRAARKPGVTMVTGSAGSGKSTALSRLVTLSDPVFREQYADELTGVPADLLPPLEAVDVAVSARERSSLEALAQVCQALRVPLRTHGWADPVTARRYALIDFLASRPAPVTIVVDALDEAKDPSGLVRNVLGPLRQAHPDRLCLLIGVRSPGGDGVTASEGTMTEEPLPDLVASELGARRIQVDHDRWWRQRDILAFVHNILTNTPDSPYRDAARTVVARVARAISAVAGRSYLMARVAAESLAHRAAVVAPDDPAWLSALDGGLFGVFRDDLHVSVPSANDRRRGVALLRAVAFARGTGLPWRRVWPRLASAVDADDGAGREYGDVDVAWLLNSRLNAYLVTDRQDDLTVYRLSHDQLRLTLRHRWRELLEADATPRTDEDDIEAVEARIALELRNQAAVRPTVAGDQAPPPYVRRHLAEHALAGGVLDEQHLPTPFLPYLDLARLRAVVDASPARRRLHEALPLLPVVRQVTHLWDWSRPARNAAAIEMWAALSRTELRGPVGGPWQVRWAVRPPDTSDVLGRHHREVWATAAADLSGTPIAVTGGADGKLHVWDLSTGTPYRDPIDAQGGAVRSVTTARLPNGRTVAITGGADGTVRIWELRSGSAVGPPLRGGRGAVVAVTAAALPDHRVVVAAADELGTVRTWDLTTREPVGAPLTGEPGMALGLATARVGQRVLGLATGRDSGLRLWDLSTGIPIGERLTGHPRAQRSSTGALLGGRAIAAAVLDDRDVAITGDGDGLLLWDLRNPAPIDRRLTGNDGTIRSLALVRLSDGRVVAMTGGNSTVQVWDLTGSGPVGEPLAGHEGSVEAVAGVESAGGTAVAVSGGRDKTVRVWEVSGRTLSGAQLSVPQVGVVEAVATARLPEGPATAISCSGTVVHVWDLEHGTLLVPPLTGHDSPVVSVAAAELPDGRVLVAAGGWDGTIRSWSAADGTPVGHGASGHQGAVASLAMATLTNERVVAVTGGWDHDVRVWDPIANTPLGEALWSHTNIVVAVATATTNDGRTVVISGSWDRHVRIGDLDAHLDPALPASRPPVDVDTGEAVAALTVATLPDGRAGVVVGGEEGTVRVVDLLDGTVVGRPWNACSGAVSAVATSRLDDGRVVVFTGGEESLVQAWDVSTGQPIGEALPTPGAVCAAVFQRQPPSLVVGGAGVAVVRPRHGDG